MSATMAILTIGVAPVAEVLPLLTEHIREEQITHISLLGKMTREDVMEDYAVESGDEGLLTLLNDNQLVEVSRQKVERDLRCVIEMLDRQEYDVILLLSSEQLSGLATHNAILLERQKWLTLENTPYYALANPMGGSDSDLLDAGRGLVEQGADVLVLDCLGYHQHHRDVLQKALDVPVLLSNVLVSRLAAELLV